ncbi:adenylate/guanylate cyclase domain-containing protein [Spirochaeta lutea]|uniref:Guanylate cyclase domain-containing protein n=1 Tax=Spirochaeta lutea TaxID=1480694 RepID=A0A098QXQ3_9SPIO|nr:adenylate/guanylate cyclase domain-containing protein [Spirochaeta lutea]KGE71252.1 hypothetical protein DC28_12455 [Spirochaeta lutea]
MQTQSNHGHLKQGDRRNVTVLFTDLEDFTRLSQDLDPEETEQLMDTVFSSFEQIIRRHEGTVEKYIGDALVAVFGTPRIHEDDPVRAVHAALDFYQVVRRLNQGFTTHNQGLRFRTGIHTGLITTGKRGDHTVVTGHTMNIAARLQSAADPGTILVSEQTHQECGGEFAVSPPQEIKAKGISDLISARKILGRSPHSLKDERFFLGNTDLESEILTAYLRFDGTSPGGFLLEGEPGSGKTALAKHIISKLRAFPDFQAPILHARARKFRSRPFAVITDSIINTLHLSPDSAPEEITAALEHQYRIPQSSARAFPATLELHSKDKAPGDYLPMLTEIFRAILSTPTPGPYQPIIFVDNTDFIDPQSMAFFRFYIRQSQQFPFFLFTDRHPGEDICSLFPDIEVREVPPLGTVDAQALIQHLQDQYQLPLKHEDVQRILTSAGGNPLFLQSYIRYMAEHHEEQNPVEVPSTVQNVYLAELSTYNDDVRDLLKKLSVFNHSFSLADAQWMQTQTQGDPGLVTRALEFFLQQDIITQENDIYYFRHDVQKKAIYNSLLNYNKRILHRLIAARMRMQDHPHPVRLVHHLVRSEAYQEALDVLKTAPDRSVNLDFLPYLELMESTFQGDDLDTQLSIQFSRCAILFNNGRTKEADTIVQKILSTAISRQHLPSAARAYHLLTGYNAKSFRYNKASYCGMKALDFYRRSNPEHPAQGNLLHILVGMETARGSVNRAQELLDELDQTARDVPAIRFAADFARIEFLEIQGLYRDAQDRLAALPDTFQDSDVPLYKERFMASLAWNRLDLEQFLSVAPAIIQSPSQDAATRARLSARTAFARHSLLGFAPGDYLDQAAFYSLRTQNDFDLLSAEAGRSQVLACLGEYEKAEAVARETLSLALRHSAFHPAFTLLMVLLETAVIRGNQKEIEFYLIEAEHIHRQGMYLDPLDTIQYRYFRAIHLPAGCQPRPEEELQELWSRTLENLQGERGVEILLGMRNFAEIQKSLESRTRS